MLDGEAVKPKEKAGPIPARGLWDSIDASPDVLKGAISDLKCRAGDLTTLKYKNAGELVQS